ncbi:sensor histidine kinase KdpD [Pusillimonas sp. ANT_WB101]|uniref:sensor histidine kinase n=1 Tax=Pusillimonas sp. ANT_WB101 TaxID=2597356 RepID=UPI0011EBD2B4|nr:HAMP domain-containing sensor histidine kinase [Pusillimonas sp. ANT_WB101]KAA0893009.1 HAMP domain-containing histidine kinase [Pusillimonas sp. ANT_WB101]
MKFIRSRFLGYGVPVIAILVLTVLLTITLLRLTDIQRSMRNTANADMVWALSQAHIESVLLSSAIFGVVAQPDRPHDIRFRYDILISRINLLIQGPQARYLKKIGASDLLTPHFQALKALGSNINDIDAGNFAYLSSVESTLLEFHRAVSAASAQALIAQWDEIGERLDKYRNAVLTVIFLMLGIWLCSAIVSIQLLFSVRKAEENQRSRQREVELKRELETERKISQLYRSFGGMISHQFRTPLAIIDATTQRMIRARDRMDSNEIARRADIIRDATQRLTVLIDGILNADRYLDKVDVKKQRCLLLDLASEAMVELQSLAPGRRIVLTDETGNASWVECDPLLTTQIISNFLSNAAKYSEPDTLIEMRIFREGRMLSCSVTDHGRGISPEELPHVFDRYFRARTAADVVGTGIGMHIASQLASLQNGEVSAYSSLGRGSTFVMRLPAPKADARKVVAPEDQN